MGVGPGYAGLAVAFACSLLGHRVNDAEARPAVGVVTRVNGATVDWTRGVLIARGASAADRHAPTPEIGRVRAERRARQAAQTQLSAIARALPWASGGTVKTRIAADEVARMRLDTVVAHAFDDDVDYGSDGSVVVSSVLPIESVRTAVVGVTAAPTAPENGPTAIVVRTREMRMPGAGMALRSGNETYAGPVIFHRSVAAARADPRLGERPIVVVSSRQSPDGALAISNGKVAAWRAAHPLIVVVLPAHTSRSPARRKSRAQ